MKPKKAQSLFHTKNTRNTKVTKNFIVYAAGGIYNKYRVTEPPEAYLKQVFVFFVSLVFFV